MNENVINEWNIKIWCHKQWNYVKNKNLLKQNIEIYQFKNPFIVCDIRMTSARNIADSDADVKIHADISGYGSGCGAPIHL